MNQHTSLVSLALASAVCAQSPEPYRVQASASETSFFQVSAIRDGVQASNRSFASFQAQGGTDNLFEFGWFYRVVGDPTNSAFNDDALSAQTLTTPPTYQFGTPPTGLQLGSMNLSWTDVDGRGFDAEWSIDVSQGGVDAAQSIHDFTITNPQPGQPLSIELFLYVDADVDGALVDSDPRLVPDGYFSVEDLFAGTFVHVGAVPTPDHWEVGEFGTGLDARIANLGYDLADTGLPFGPGDWTGAMQWSLTIPPQSSSVVQVSLGRNLCPNPGGVVASATNYGTALPGANGPMQLVSLPPSLGHPYDIFVGNGPQFGVATMLVGSGPLNVTVCSVSILVDQWATLSIPLDIVGSGVLTIDTPCDPLLNGFQLFTQVFAVDPTSQSACYPLIHSRGLHTVFAGGG